MKTTNSGFCTACGVTGRVVIVGPDVGQLCAACVNGSRRVARNAGTPDGAEKAAHGF